jgi:hypothetical protein
MDARLSLWLNSGESDYGEFSKKSVPQTIVGESMGESMTEPPTGEPRPGRYRHYKGKHYIVLGTARHSETEEALVVYRQDYGERSLWVRPLAMFLESVEQDGRRVPRFEYCGDATAGTDGME